jgi:hypothetical protein
VVTAAGGLAVAYTASTPERLGFGLDADFPVDDGIHLTSTIAAGSSPTEAQPPHSLGCATYRASVAVSTRESVAWSSRAATRG